MSREALVKFSNRHKDVLYKFILEGMGSRESFTALDIGCRWGEDLAWLAHAYPRSKGCGVDLELEPLKSSNKRFKDNDMYNVFLGGAECLPFKDGSFDLVISSEVIEHTAQVEAFIREAHRVLKKGGLFIITTPSKYTYSVLLGYLVPRPFKKRLRKLVYHINPGGDEDPHFREYSPREMRLLFQKNNLRVEKIEGSILRVPIWLLFEKVPFLLSVWEKLDRFIGKIPLGTYLKHNFIMWAVKN